MRESVPLWSRENVIGPNNIHWWHSVNEASVGCFAIHPVQNRGEKRKKEDDDVVVIVRSFDYPTWQTWQKVVDYLGKWSDTHTHGCWCSLIGTPVVDQLANVRSTTRKEKERKESQRGWNTVIIRIALMHPLLMTRLSFPWRRHLIEYFAVTYGICCCCYNNNNKFKFLKLRWHTIGNHATCIHKYRPSSDALSIPRRASERRFGRGSSRPPTEKNKKRKTWLDQRWRRPHLAAISLEFNQPSHGEWKRERESERAPKCVSLFEKLSQKTLAVSWFASKTLIIQFNYFLISRAPPAAINLSASPLANSPGCSGCQNRKKEKERLH